MTLGSSSGQEGRVYFYLCHSFFNFIAASIVFVLSTLGSPCDVSAQSYEKPPVDPVCPAGRDICYYTPQNERPDDIIKAVIDEVNGGAAIFGTEGFIRKTSGGSDIEFWHTSKLQEIKDAVKGADRFSKFVVRPFVEIFVEVFEATELGFRNFQLAINSYNPLTALNRRSSANTGTDDTVTANFPIGGGALQAALAAGKDSQQIRTADTFYILAQNRDHINTRYTETLYKEFAVFTTPQSDDKGFRLTGELGISADGQQIMIRNPGLFYGVEGEDDPKVPRAFRTNGDVLYLNSNESIVIGQITRTSTIKKKGAGFLRLGDSKQEVQKQLIVLMRARVAANRNDFSLPQAQEILNDRSRAVRVSEEQLKNQATQRASQAIGRDVEIGKSLGSSDQDLKHAIDLAVPVYGISPAGDRILGFRLKWLTEAIRHQRVEVLVKGPGISQRIVAEVQDLTRLFSFNELSAAQKRAPSSKFLAEIKSFDQGNVKQSMEFTYTPYNGILYREPK